MGFLLRQISHSAEGREIVRSSQVRGDTLEIGRDPSSDVRLTDLAVSLRHATLERVSPERIGISAEKGLTIELNGRSVQFGRFEISAGAEIRIGTHLLRVMPGSPADKDISVNVEKVTEGEAKLDKDDEKKFSLVSVMPSKRAAAYVFTLAVLALFLAWPIKSIYDRQTQEPVPTMAATVAAAGTFHPDSLWSSGSLSQAHKGLENNCKACHVRPFEAVRDDSCKSCHTQIHDHADPYRLARAEPDLTRLGKVRLAFQEAFNIPPGRCVECHTEHEGPQQMPATAQRFCSDCHQGLSEKLPDTKLANAGDFGTSHPEFQPAVMTRWNGDRPVLQRVSLAQRPREMSNLKFPHDMHLSKTNGVAQMARRLAGDHGFGQSLACKDCHDSDPSGTRFQPVNMEEDCGMCHSLAFDVSGGTLRTLRHGEPQQVVADLRDMFRARAPSPPATLGGMSRRRPGDVMVMRNARQFQIGSTAPGRADRAIRAVFSRGGACYDCHQVEAPARGLNYKIKPVAFSLRYMHKGWFDHKAHATETCESCHKATTSASSNDLLLPDLNSCRTCHGGEASNKAVPSSCAMCHDYHFDTGSPSFLIRQKVRGKERDSVADDKPVVAGVPKSGGGGSEPLVLIAQITDVHLGFEPDNPAEFNRKRLDQTLKVLAAMKPLPDLLLVTGDLADEGDDGVSYRRLKGALAGAPFPIWYCMGNDDSRESFLDHFPHVPAPDGFIQYALEEFPLRILVIDTLEVGRHGGGFCETRAAWLTARLAEQPERPTLLVLHHPPIETGLSWMTENPDAAWVERLHAIVLAQSNIVGMIAGHLHRVVVTQWAGTTLAVCPSTAPQVALDLERIDPNRPDGRPMIVADPPAYAIHYWNGEQLVSHFDTAEEHTVLARYEPALQPLVQMLLAEKTQAPPAGEKLRKRSA